MFFRSCKDFHSSALIFVRFLAVQLPTFRLTVSIICSKVFIAVKWSIWWHQYKGFFDDLQWWYTCLRVGRFLKHSDWSHKRNHFEVIPNQYERHRNPVLYFFPPLNNAVYTFDTTDKNCLAEKSTIFAVQISCIKCFSGVFLDLGSHQENLVRINRWNCYCIFEYFCYFCSTSKVLWCGGESTNLDQLTFFQRQTLDNHRISIRDDIFDSPPLS